MKAVTIRRTEAHSLLDDIVDSILGMRYEAYGPDDIFAYCYGYTAGGCYRRARRKMAREQRRRDQLAQPPRRPEKVVRRYTEAGERVR